MSANTKRVTLACDGVQLSDAHSLGVAEVVALDDNAAIDKLAVDAIADTVGGEVGAKLLAKVKREADLGMPLSCRKMPSPAIRK